jgi:regulator of replication initiation timing
MSDLLKDLSEESMTKIQEAIETKVKEKVSIHVEKALTEQDELYSSKLNQLLKAIDSDHSKKLQKVVEAIDTDRASKLKMVVSKYEQTLNNDASAFKAQLVESISDYLETYLDEKVPTADIQEAVRNKKALVVLESLRNHLAVDAALQKESIKEAILDGKTQISEASQKLESVIQENAQLKSELDSIKANLFVEQKSASLDESQKKYIKKVMAGKSADFINENFDYTVKLFNKKSSDRLDTLKEEALSESTKVDRVVLEQTEEQQPQQLSPYLRELSKY